LLAQNQSSNLGLFFVVVKIIFRMILSLSRYQFKFP